MMIAGTNEFLKISVFLKSAWRHSVIDYYDKARNTPCFAPWHLGDKLGVYRLPQCNYKNLEEILQITRQIIKKYDWK